MKTPLKYGHRGAMAYETENTMASIKKALELEVDGLEIDVHKCASGELVVFHDFTLDRLSNGSGEISNKTWDQLKELKINGDHTIPRLQDVLDVVDKNCIVNIELKGIDTATATSLLIDHYIRDRHWSHSHFLVSSFQFSELKQMQELNPKIERAVLTKANVQEAITLARLINATTIHPNYALLTATNVKSAQGSGFKVNTWTVNEEDTIARMKSYGVDGIISDYPDRL